MAYTAGFSVSVGDPTKASNITTLAANDDFLKAAVDAIMTDSATPSASIKSTVVLADGVAATTQSNGDNSTKVATTAYADAQGVSFSNDANNRVVTGTGSGINGEANLTFDGSTLALSGDQTNYEDSNDANNSISLGTSATERLEIKSMNASGTKTLEELRFTTKTASGTGDHAKMTFYMDDVERFKILDAGIQFGTGDAFTVEYDKFNITGSSNPPFEINTTNTKKLLLKDVDDSSLIFAEGSTERATITWSASGDSLTIYNEEESRGVRINTDFEYYNGSSWSSLTSGGGGSVAGSDSQIQYNNGGAFGGDADFVWDDTNHRVGINVTPTEALSVEGITRSSAAWGSGFPYRTAGGSHEFATNVEDQWIMFLTHEHSAGPYGLAMYYPNKDTSSASGNQFLTCYDSGFGGIAQIRGNGTFGSATNTYGAYSDEKLKKDIEDANLQNQWDDIKAVKLRNFNYKARPQTRMLGVIAQELETVSPNLIDEEVDINPETRKELGTTTKFAKYSVLYLKAVGALQVAIQKIETLEQKVATLEAK